MDSNYILALSYYKHAFTFLSPKLKDIQNAILVAQESNDIKEAINFSKLLIYKGVKLDFFKQQKFRSLTQNKLWQKFKKKKYHKIKNKYVKHNNVKLRKQIIEMFERDQYYRKISNKDSVIKMDQLNGILIKNIFQTYGYPNEDKIGVFMENDSTFYQTDPIGIMLIHQVDYQSPWLIEKLKNYAKEGDLPLSFFIKLGDRINNDSTLLFGIDYGGQCIFKQINDELYTIENSKLKLIDTNRMVYNLESIEDVKKKIFFYYFKSKKYKLNIAYSYSITKFQGEEAKLKFIEKNHLILVKKLPSNAPYLK